MNWLRRSLWFPAVLAVASLALVAGSASALNLRSPQVPFNFGPLQGYLNVVDPGINVATDQVNAQVWSVAITGNTDFTLALKSGLGAGNSVGVYNALAPMGPIPPLFQVFPGGAVAGWYAALHFGGGNLSVSTFNQASVFQGTVTYPGVNPNNFGFYTQGPGGIWFSQDARNAPAGPQMLTYDSVAFPGDFWLCFEVILYGPAATFDGVVINVQSIRPTPAKTTTWGEVKSKYR
jgi:hypothetical protein